MFADHKYEKAIGKLNKVLSENGMNIESIGGVDIATIEDPEPVELDISDDAITEKKYYAIQVEILIPVEGLPE